MKIAFVFMHPFSESMGSVVRLRELSFSLAELGAEVFILTPYAGSFDLSPNVHVVALSSFLQSMGISKLLYRFSKRLYYNQAFPEIFSSFQSENSIVVDRLVNSVAKVVMDLGIDVIQVEQDAALPIAVGLKSKTDLPVVLDVHNVSSEELVALNLLKKNSKKFSYLQDLTQRGLSRIDHTFVVSECMKNYVTCNYGLSGDCVSVVPPGGRLIANRSIIDGRTAPVKVVYAGLVSHRENVRLFVESMSVFLDRDRDVQFFVTDKGEDIKEIKRLADCLRVDPTFFWYHDYEGVNRFLCSSQIGVVTSSNDLARQMGTPVKFFNYLSAGLPVVANEIGGDWTRIIEKEGVGLVAGSDPKDFGEALLSLVDDPKLLRQCSYDALSLVESKYNWSNSAKSLLQVCESLTQRR